MRYGRSIRGVKTNSAEIAFEGGYKGDDDDDDAVVWHDRPLLSSLTLCKRKKSTFAYINHGRVGYSTLRLQSLGNKSSPFRPDNYIPYSSTDQGHSLRNCGRNPMAWSGH